VETERKGRRELKILKREGEAEVSEAKKKSSSFMEMEKE